jgi:hypothetical protein
MAMLQRYDIDHEGYISATANGDYYLARDVGRMEDDLEDAAKEIAKLKQALAAANEAHRIAVLRAPIPFGYCDPDQAGPYLTGGSGEILVTRQKTETNIMHVYFNRGPRKYKRSLPGIRARVLADGHKGRVKAHEVDGLIVKLDSGQTVKTRNWSYLNDTQATARQGANGHGPGAGQNDRGAGGKDRGAVQAE